MKLHIKTGAVYWKFSQGFYFRETLHMQSFVKIKFLRNGEITLSFTYEGKLCHTREFLCGNMSLNAIHANFRIYSSLSEVSNLSGNLYFCIFS